MSADTVAAPAPTARAPRWWDRVPPAWRFVLGLFLGTKLVVTAAALLAIHAFDDIRGQLPGAQARDDMTYGAVSPHRAIAVWFPWDALHSLRLGRVPVTGPDSARVLHFCSPPLYPWLGKLISPLVGGSAVAALLLVSNGAFLLLLYYAYRLAERLWGEADDARRFARYVVLMPTAFIFQAALTESLFLCLVVACFYYAESRRWLVVGRYLRPAYVVYGLIFVLMPLSIGPLAAYRSLLRYLLMVFPLALLFTRWGRRPGIDPYLTAGLALVQGVLLVTWANDWVSFII